MRVYNDVCNWCVCIQCMYMMCVCVWCMLMDLICDMWYVCICIRACVFEHVYLYIIVCMWYTHLCVWAWVFIYNCLHVVQRTTLGCLPLLFFEAGLLGHHCVHQDSWLELPSFSCLRLVGLSYRTAGVRNVCHSIQPKWVLGIWIQVLMLTQQARALLTEPFPHHLLSQGFK